ncbi:hypothetical protein CHH58_16945 [Terribacillus saccharophilus]|uniref:Uncharacterized protein n=1 Tax=Terribacillus saccharophilus TaxID=361277 RepID=A0A268A7D6_9BACI|nr:hypothetical protein CHH64_16510 [Terribacillus saccharophilus]PAF17278.1 hypothetical protein CHH51_13855 [Terribacillus saccharophilus]PAF20582.1 hypothetical protein CHH49_16015 [Terribacillus saccharophilus]PAF35475.1 hypothetical protein CHH58_16945 [Terribacillus saccharophilus]
MRKTFFSHAGPANYIKRNSDRCPHVTMDKCRSGKSFIKPAVNQNCQQETAKGEKQKHFQKNISLPIGFLFSVHEWC